MFHCFTPIKIYFTTERNV